MKMIALFAHQLKYDLLVETKYKFNSNNLAIKTL